MPVFWINYQPCEPTDSCWELMSLLGKEPRVTPGAPEGNEHLERWTNLWHYYYYYYYSHWMREKCTLGVYTEWMANVSDEG